MIPVDRSVSVTAEIMKLVPVHMATFNSARFYETSGLSLLLGKPAQREGARTGLEVLCEVLHPTLS